MEGARALSSGLFADGGQSRWHAYSAFGDAVAPREEDEETASRVAWDALTPHARDTLAADTKACAAAVALIEVYRTPPRLSHRRRTCWRREDVDDDAGNSVLTWPRDGQSGRPLPQLPSSFYFREVDAELRAIQPVCRAQLLVCSEKRVFDEDLLRHYRAQRTAGFALTVILHLGGRVASGVTQQNILRESFGLAAAPAGAPDTTHLSARVEVHASHSIVLYGIHEEESPFSIVPAACAPQVLEYYGIPDVACLPPVDATSREVMLTGALERDIVQVIEPMGVALVFVTPATQSDADMQYDRLMQELRARPERQQRRDDLARRVRNAFAAECSRLLAASATWDQREDAARAWSALETWVDAPDFAQARGCPARSRQVFESMAEVSPALHAELREALGATDVQEEAWQDDLFLVAAYEGIYAARHSRAVAAAVYDHHTAPVEDGDFDAESASEEECEPPHLPPLVVRAREIGAAWGEERSQSSGPTPPASPSGCESSSRSSSPSQRDGEETPGQGDHCALVPLVHLQALLSDRGWRSDSDEDDGETRGRPPLEQLRESQRDFLDVFRRCLSQRGHTYWREDFCDMQGFVERWYAIYGEDRHCSRDVFWERCAEEGLPACVASTLQRIVCSDGVSAAVSLRSELATVEFWIEQGARSAPRRAGR